MSIEPKAGEAAEIPAPISTEMPSTAAASMPDDVVADAPPGSHGDAASGVGTEGYPGEYSPPYHLPPSTIAPEYGAYASGAYTYTPGSGEGAVPTADPAYTSPAVTPGAQFATYATQTWNPNAYYPQTDSVPPVDTQVPSSTSTTALSAHSAEYVIAGEPMPYSAEPNVEYGTYLNTVAGPQSYYEGAQGPPGIEIPLDAPAAFNGVVRDEALEARVNALEWHAYEAASRARDAEIDLLMHKVGMLEEMIMRFLSEVPIRLGGEIGVLERRVTYLTEELPARLHAESGTATESIDRLNQRVAALERFAQTVPTVRWQQEQQTRNEALERRVVELEQFCTALARKGTAPREVAANTTEEPRSAGGPNGPARPAMPNGANRNGVPARPIQAREAERRRSR